MVSMSNPPFILLLPVRGRPPGTRVTLPSSDDNLFQRIIRDPTAPHRPARERLCTELLCGILLNAPSTAGVVLRSLGDVAGVAAAELAELDWRFSTEGAIGSKRDDLRIEGWTHNEEPKRVVLWTIEVKVAAGIHVSGRQDFDDDGLLVAIDGESDLLSVSQIENYDEWLSKQSAIYRAGFVLAIVDMADELPSNLKMPWQCLTWTQLAMGIEEAIGDNLVPDSEQILASHLCGFIRDHLWNEVPMESAQFSFDDMALLRAFSQIGFGCFGKVQQLVDKCQPVLNELLAGFYERNSQYKGLSGPNTRLAANFTLLPAEANKAIPPILYAGIDKGAARVWIETSPKSAAKEHVRRLVKSAIDQLRQRNPLWQPEGETEWIDVSLSKSLEWLLASDDQQASFNGFVAAAITDLKETGLVQAISQELRKG